MQHHKQRMQHSHQQQQQQHQRRQQPSLRMQHAVVLLLAAAAATLPQPAAAAAGGKACLLKLQIQPRQSGWRGDGGVTAPVPSKVVSPPLNATGTLYLRVPSSGSCPPNLTADNADNLLAQSSLEVPLDSPSITFTPPDIKSKVLADGSTPLGRLNFLGLGLGLTGNEPLGPGTVRVGSGAAADARAAAQPVCAQLLMLNGTLDLSNDIVGTRTADVRHVAFNRTLDAGVAVKKDGSKVTNVTLVLSNVTLLFDIAPGTTPGVEFTRARYMLSGDVVATADASAKGSWKEVDADQVAWGAVPRKDSPVILGANKPVPAARLIGVNSTLDQQCKPTRVVDGGAGGGGGGQKSGGRAVAASGLAAAASGVLAAAALLA